MTKIVITFILGLMLAITLFTLAKQGLDREAAYYRAEARV